MKLPVASDPTRTSFIPEKLKTLSAKSSIKYKSDLSQYLSPYANISKSIDCMPDISDFPPQITPHIKIVPYGTGTGKTYGALKQYILLCCMRYPDRATDKILKRNKSKNNFTNGIFVTPFKNQISFDQSLVDEMLDAGITPLSLISVIDGYTSTTKMWNGGMYSIQQRLDDYEKTLSRLSSLTKNPKNNIAGWQRSHIKVLSGQIRTIKELIKEIHSLQTGITTKEAEDQIKILGQLYNRAVNLLVLIALNNNYRTQEVDMMDVEKVSDENFESDDVDYDSISTEIDGSANKEVDGVNPIAPNAVFKEIFLLAKPKPHFDDYLYTQHESRPPTLNDDDDFECVLATFKKDVLRVYGPMNYAAYMPSFICMTSAKFVMRPSMFRQSLKKDDLLWVHTSSDYSDYAELIGNKIQYKQALDAIPSSDPNASSKQLEMLKSTVMHLRTDNPSPYAVNDIDFYIIIDEANQLFKTSFEGSDFADGVVKRILDRTSITDLFSCLERKYYEFCYQPTTTIDCYEQIKYFFECMYAYLDNYCEIDPNKVFSKKPLNASDKALRENLPYLLQFNHPPNILYIDNSEAKSITSLIKNAFSVTSKKFIDKEKLEAIFVCSSGQQRYLSSNKKSENDINLYEFYQIILAALFAAIKFEATGTNKFSPQERQAFRLDLGGGMIDNGMVRQNQPLAALLAFARAHAARYKDWLISDHYMNAHPDAIIDDWVAFIQTKILFTLTHNTTFDASPDLGHQSKTFVDIRLHLITHHPEIDMLKMVSGTRNHLHIMSATSGKTHAYSDQFNIEFMKRWGSLLGVRVTLPEYDHEHHIDYRETFTAFREFRASMRQINVITYKEARDINQLVPSTKVTSSPTRISLNRNHSEKLSPAQLKSYLLAVNQSLNGARTFIAHGTHNDRALSNAVSGLLLAFQSSDTNLIIAYRMDLFKFLLASIQAQFKAPSNISRITHALHTKQTSVNFSHSIFGEFELPLLNDFLEKNASYVSLKKILNKIDTEYSYMVDFFGLSKRLNIPKNNVVRLALYDSKIARIREDYREFFEVKEIIHRGIQRTLYTTIVSYTQAAAFGLNNVIENSILEITEDVNRLMLPSLSYWTGINDKSDSRVDGLDGRHKIGNTLIYMRYLADISYYKPTRIRDFDSNLSGQEAHDLLTVEHNLQNSNTFKQSIGRVERQDSNPEFMSEIILPIDGLKEQTKINYIAYGLDASLKSTRDKTDFSFMSLNNYYVLKHGMSLLEATTTTEDQRKRLERDTAAAQRRIHDFTDGYDGFMSKLLQAARAGSQSAESRELADAAIEFDRMYRNPCILLAPKLWLKDLKDSSLLNSPLLLSKLGWHDVATYLNDMFVDLSTYTTKGALEPYQYTSNGKLTGLTDFFGRHTGNIEPYCPSKFVVSNINPASISSNDSRLQQLVAYGNMLTDHTSDLYDAENQQSLILHPAMMHMALGNLAERLFERFMQIYSGEYIEFSDMDIINRYGYELYEVFDYWLYNTSSNHWVCVDIKNFSHRENIGQTDKLLASSTRKISQISKHDLFCDSNDSELADYLSLIDGAFDGVEVMHMIFLNVRNGEYSESKRVKRDLTLNGKPISIHIHHLCLYKPVRFLDVKDRKLVVTGDYPDGSPKKIKNRKEILSINPTLLDVLSIDKTAAVDIGFGTNDSSIVDDYDLSDASTEIFLQNQPESDNASQ